MHRSNFRFQLAFILLAALSLSPLRADPIITAEPAGKSAFLGTSSANVTFDVVATSTSNTTLTYQWQYKPSSGSFANCTDNATFNGSTTANLTVNNTDTSLNNYKFKCFITDFNTTVNTVGVTLSVFTAPTLTPNLTVTPSTIVANSTANISFTITGMDPGGSVRVQEYLSLNSSGSVNISDPLVADFFITDGAQVTFGGVTDPVIPGDDDGTADGNLTTHITLPTSTEMGKASGTYLIKVSSVGGKFTPVTQSLTIAQPAYGQSVSGQVLNGATPLPNALVAALTQDSSGDFQFVAGTVADSSGNYTLNLPTGSYGLLGLKSGYVASSSSLPFVTVNSSDTQTGVNVTLTSATTMITGSTVDSTNSNTVVRGVQIIGSSDGGDLLITATNNDGNFTAPVTADNWTFDISDYSLPRLGYLRPQNKGSANTTAGDASLQLQFEPVNALIYGNITTSGGSPIVGVVMDADDGGNYENTGTTDANGTYYLGVYGSTTSNGNNWSVQADDNNPALAGLIPFSGNNYSVFADTATVANFTTQAVTAYLNGTVTNNGAPVANLSLQATQIINDSGPSQFAQNTTDSNGNFSLGVFAGNWTLQINYGDSHTPSNIIGENLTYNVTDNVNVNNISFLAQNSTATISGNVVDSSDQPLTNDTIVATANLSGNAYFVSTQTDGSGHYSLPVVNGTWSVSVSYSQPIFPVKSVTISGSSQTLDIAPTGYAVWQFATFSGNDPYNSLISGVDATPGGDGITNLVKYAFNLPPYVNARASLPQATLSGSNLTLVFNAIRSDVTYTVEASTDLSNWSTTGVTIQTSGQQVTATYDLSGHPIAFMRIVVTLND